MADFGITLCTPVATSREVHSGRVDLQFFRGRSMYDNPYLTPAPITNVPPTRRNWLKTLLFAAVLSAIVIVVIGLLPVHRGREAARRTQCKNNLKQIALAFHNYHDKYESFPPAYTVDEKGDRLHSWRTLILPYLEQQNLYAKIDLSKSWDDPVNAEALTKAPAVYRCPGAQLPEGHTNYLAFVGETLCLHPTNGRALSEITDGTSSTLMVMEVTLKDSVPWMSPQDADEQMFLSLSNEDELQHTGATQTALVDGSARFIAADSTPETRRALISINGNEPLGEF
jgi:hypothetical protein